MHGWVHRFATADLKYKNMYVWVCKNLYEWVGTLKPKERFGYEEHSKINVYKDTTRPKKGKE